MKVGDRPSWQGLGFRVHQTLNLNPTRLATWVEDSPAAGLTGAPFTPTKWWQPEQTEMTCDRQCKELSGPYLSISVTICLVLLRLLHHCGQQHVALGPRGRQSQTMRLKVMLEGE